MRFNAARDAGHHLAPGARVEPVNATLATSGCCVSAAPRSFWSAMTLSTPGGRIDAASSPKRRVVSGVVGAGFATTVLPASSAGASLDHQQDHREVPRRDGRDDAERRADLDDLLRGVFRAAPSGSMFIAANGVDHGDRAAEFVFRLRRRVCPVPASAAPAHSSTARGQRVGEREQQGGGALPRICATTAGKAGLGGGDRVVELRDVGARARTRTILPVAGLDDVRSRCRAQARACLLMSSLNAASSDSTALGLALMDILSGCLCGRGSGQRAICDREFGRLDFSEESNMRHLPGLAMNIESNWTPIRRLFTASSFQSSLHFSMATVTADGAAARRRSARCCCAPRVTRCISRRFHAAHAR